MSTVYFDSRKNYLTRDNSSGSTNMSGPSVSAYSGYIFTSNLVINHNLGYVPLFRVYYEPFGDGTVFPGITLRRSQRAFNLLPTGTSDGPGMIYWADKNTVTIQLFYTDASLVNKTFPVYYVIYKDIAL